VEYTSERGRYYERIAGWPIGDCRRWIAISADGTQVDENLNTLLSLNDVTGFSRYPGCVHDLEQFDSSLEDDELCRRVLDCRAVALELERVGGLATSVLPTWYFNRHGNPISFPGR